MRTFTPFNGERLDDEAAIINERVGALVDFVLEQGDQYKTPQAQLAKGLALLDPTFAPSGISILEDKTIAAFGTGNALRVRLIVESPLYSEENRRIVEFSSVLKGSKPGNSVAFTYILDHAGRKFTLECLEIVVPSGETSWSFPRVTSEHSYGRQLEVNPDTGVPLDNAHFFSDNLGSPVVCAEVRSRLDYLETVFTPKTPPNS